MWRGQLLSNKDSRKRRGPRHAKPAKFRPKRTKGVIGLASAAPEALPLAQSDINQLDDVPAVDVVRALASAREHEFRKPIRRRDAIRSAIREVKDREAAEIVAARQRDQEKAELKDRIAGIERQLTKPKHAGGAPEVWDWVALRPQLKDLADKPADLIGLVNWCQDHVKPRPDKRPKALCPDGKTTKVAISRHGLDKICDL
jgi:hypothetical protein